VNVCFYSRDAEFAAQGTMDVQYAHPLRLFNVHFLMASACYKIFIILSDHYIESSNMKPLAVR
jgi:hypothetical protein